MTREKKPHCEEVSPSEAGASHEASAPHEAGAQRTIGRCQFAGLALAISVSMTMLAGCQTGRGGEGALAVRSQADQGKVLAGGFDTVVYKTEGDLDTATLLLLEGPIENPTQAVTVRMFWKPKAGRTPISRQATNATVHYVIFAGEEVGIYSGAGFVFPSGKPGKGTLKFSVWDANLVLSDRTNRFSDRLGPALVRGSVVAKLDEAKASALLNDLNRLIRQRLGSPRLVQAAPATGPDKSTCAVQ